MRVAGRLLGGALLIALAACGEGPTAPAHLRVPGGDPAEGRKLIQAYGCVTCHVVGGVRGPRATVGPPLADFAGRKLLAGIFPNTPGNLVSWLLDPPALVPATGMPAIGLSEPEARDVAAYLFTLGAGSANVYPGGPPLEMRGREEPILQSEGLQAPAEVRNPARDGSL
jgi:cytochrome c2